MISFLTGLIVLISYLQQPAPSLQQLRYLYQKASTQKHAAENLIKQLAGQELDAPVTTVCYKGVANILLAKYSSNPITKYRLFNDGKALISQAIGRDSLNIEARLLRFTIQYHAPTFLGYRSKLKADETFLRLSLTQIKDEELKAMVEKMLAISRADQ